MKTQITQDQFEDIHFSTDLVVVEKQKTFGKDEHITWLYVFTDHENAKAHEVYTRVITATGTTFYQETLCLN